MLKKRGYATTPTNSIKFSGKLSKHTHVVRRPDKLCGRIVNHHETPMHNYKPLLRAAAIILVMIITLIVGMHVGRSHTIRQAELLETNGDTYYIGFGDDVHEYTFD